MAETQYDTDHIYYTSGYKYSQENKYVRMTGVKPKANIHTPFIDLFSDGRLTIKPGFASDGGSGPAVDTKAATRGFFEHDAFYKLMRMSLLPLDYRKIVDKELYKIHRKDGVSWLRANWIYAGVRIGGKSSTLPKNKKVVKVTP